MISWDFAVSNGDFTLDKMKAENRGDVVAFALAHGQSFSLYIYSINNGSA